MANTKKTSTKSTSTKAKTVPAKKPAKKPAGASKKPAARKEVAVKSQTTKVQKTQPTKRSASAKGKTHNHFSEVIFGLIMIVLALAIAAGAVFYFCCGRDENVVMIDVDDQNKIPSHYVEIADYQIQFLVPDGFTRMSDEDIKNTNFGISEEVKLAYINEDKSAVIALGQSDAKVANDDVKNYTNAIKSAVTTAGAKDINTNYYDSSEHNIGTIRYLSTNSEQSYPFHAIAIFSHDDKATSLIFQCTEAARGYWEKASDTIIKSIKFVEKE